MVACSEHLSVRVNHRSLSRSKSCSLHHPGLSSSGFNHPCLRDSGSGLGHSLGHLSLSSSGLQHPCLGDSGSGLRHNLGDLGAHRCLHHLRSHYGCLRHDQGLLRHHSLLLNHSLLLRQRIQSQAFLLLVFGA